MARSIAGWWSATIRREVRRIAHPLPERLEHRDLEHRSFPRPFALVECRENPCEGIHAGCDVRNRDANFRRGFRRPRHGDEPRFALHKQIIGLLVAIGSRSAVAGDGANNEARVALCQFLGAKTQSLGGPRGKVLDEHVRVLQKLEDNQPGLRVLEIKRETLLGAIEPDEVARHPPHGLIIATCKVPNARALNFDDARSQVGQLARRKRGRDRLFKRDDGDSL